MSDRSKSQCWMQSSSTVHERPEVVHSVLAFTVHVSVTETNVWALPRSPVPLAVIGQVGSLTVFIVPSAKA